MTSLNQQGAHLTAGQSIVNVFITYQCKCNGVILQRYYLIKIYNRPRENDGGYVMFYVNVMTFWGGANRELDVSSHVHVVKQDAIGQHGGRVSVAVSCIFLKTQA